MTRRRGVEAAEDPALLTVADSFAPVVTLVGKTWGLHLEKVTKVSREENLAMIAESVAFCRERGKRVVYDAEHFFDAYREDPGYALSCLEAAIDAGAENVTLCDTNGASLPNQVAAATEVVVDALRRPRRNRHPRPRRRRAAGSPTASPRSTPGRAWCRGR